MCATKDTAPLAWLILMCTLTSWFIRGHEGGLMTAPPSRLLTWLSVLVSRAKNDGEEHVVRSKRVGSERGKHKEVSP